MTKAEPTSRPAEEVAQPKTDPSPIGVKAKRQRGKAAPSNEGCATTATAIAATECPTETLTADAPITATIPAAPSKPPRQTKAAFLRAKLVEPGGVSLATLIEATGWQAHTLRAALSGLRKEGLPLTRRREGEDTIYAIDPSGTAAGKTAGDGGDKEAASKEPREAMPQDGDAGSADAASAFHPAESNA